MWIICEISPENLQVTVKAKSHCGLFFGIKNLTWFGHLHSVFSEILSEVWKDPKIAQSPSIISHTLLHVPSVTIHSCVKNFNDFNRCGDYMCWGWGVGVAFQWPDAGQRVWHDRGMLVYIPGLYEKFQRFSLISMDAPVGPGTVPACDVFRHDTCAVWLIATSITRVADWPPVINATINSLINTAHKLNACVANCYADC